MARRVRKDRLLVVIATILVIGFLLVKLVGGIYSKINPPVDNKPKVKTAEELQAERDNIIRIAIDPAKGGINKGRLTSDSGMYEKDIALDIAKRIRGIISQHKDVNVTLTRSFDDEKDLKSRVEVAKKNNSDILVSIRMNAQGRGNDANGISTYYPKAKVKKTELSSIAKDDGDEETKKEKEVIERYNLSEDLATDIQKTTVSFVEMEDRGIINQGFDILNFVQMPAVIVHCGFITNEEDCRKLEDEKVREDIAKGIAQGILKFVDTNRKEIINDRVNFK